MTRFIDVIENWSKTASWDELIELKKVIDNVLSDENIDSHVYHLCSNGQKLGAVKYVHNMKGCTLKEALHYVDGVIVKKRYSNNIG